MIVGPIFGRLSDPAVGGADDAAGTAGGRNLAGTGEEPRMRALTEVQSGRCVVWVWRVGACVVSR